MARGQPGSGKREDETERPITGSKGEKQPESDTAEHRSGERRLLEIIEDQIDRAFAVQPPGGVGSCRTFPRLGQANPKAAETAELLLDKRAGRMQSDRDRQGNGGIVSDKAVIHGPSHGEGHERPGLGDDGRGHDDKLDESWMTPGLRTAASSWDGPDQSTPGTSPSLPPCVLISSLLFPPDAGYFWGCLGGPPSVLHKYLLYPCPTLDLCVQNPRGRHRDRQRR